MKIYLSGSIKHDPDYVAKFARYEEQLIENAPGWDYVEVVNPVTIEAHQPDFGYHDFMREDIRALLDCDAIGFIPGWEQSTGARVELTVAVAIGLEILFL